MIESINRDDSVEETPEEYLKWRAERHRRYAVVIAAVPALIGLTAGLLAVLLPDNNEFIFYLVDRSALGLIAPAMMLFSGVGVLMIYLQTGFSKKTEVTSEYFRYEDELARLRNRIENGDSASNGEFERLKMEVSRLRSELEINSSINAAITSDHKNELVKLLKNEILENSTDQATKEFIEKVKKDIKESDQSREIERLFSRTLERLYTETSALGFRGNLNLSLGILTTIVGLVILGYFVIEIDSVPEDKIAFIAHFIPRLSLVVLIEIFAYFFLKLYKSSLSEIKYFQNEVTNVEAKLAALKCSLMINDIGSISSVIKVLSETERNSILQKGQTTAEIEKSKIEHQNITTISNKVSKLIGAK
jgi:hypothetical protein